MCLLLCPPPPLCSAARLAVLESMLRWRHMAPTAPDTLACYPFADNDPFILHKCPHVFFAGNQPAFETRLLQGEAGWCGVRVWREGLSRGVGGGGGLRVDGILLSGGCGCLDAGLHRAAHSCQVWKGCGHGSHGTSTSHNNLPCVVLCPTKVAVPVHPHVSIHAAWQPGLSQTTPAAWHASQPAVLAASWVMLLLPLCIPLWQRSGLIFCAVVVVHVPALQVMAGSWCGWWLCPPSSLAALWCWSTCAPWQPRPSPSGAANAGVTAQRLDAI